jgi:hypothetical protein
MKMLTEVVTVPVVALVTMEDRYELLRRRLRRLPIELVSIV